MADEINSGQSSWEVIQQGVHEVERMIGRKRYNAAMCKAREVLEFMVNELCRQSGIEERSLIDQIEGLNTAGVIDDTTYEHYNRIRMIGNKAIHDDDNSAYNANQAHHLLSQEVYTFANGESARKSRTRTPAQGRDGGLEVAVSRNSGRHAGDVETGIAERAAESHERAGRPLGSGDTERRLRHHTASARRRRHGRGPAVDPAMVLRTVLLVAIIIVLAVIIHLIKPPKGAGKTTAVAVESSLEDVAEASTEPVVTSYVTTDSVRVRSTATTEDESNVLTTLAAGTKVTWIRDENSDWAVIDYNGTEAYISRRFIKAEEN